MPTRLAIDGGTPVRTTAVPTWPSPGDAEVAAVCEVVRSGRLNYWTGNEGTALEAEYATDVGRAHAVAVANGTLALELAMRSLGIGPGDDVVVPARTFVATASSVVAVGARPVIADIDPDSNNLTAATVSEALTDSTRAVIPVHLGGWPVDMDPLLELARQRGLIVIEDCAQAHGGSYHGRRLGATGSHAGTFSFCQDKVVPAGEGGLLVIDDTTAFTRAWEYKDHGKSLERSRTAPAASGALSFRWLVDDFGTNWRMDEMAAALARAGLARLGEWHEARTRNALRIASGLSGVEGLRVPLPQDGLEHAFYRLYCRIEPDRLAPGWDRDRVTAAIRAEGVPVQYGSCAEIYREPAFAAHGFGPADRLPGAALAHEQSFAFFVHPTLGPEDIDDVVTATRKVMEVAAP